MTKRDFDLIAKVISHAIHGPEAEHDLNNCIPKLAIAFANALKITNLHFNRTKFLHACGVVE